MEDRAGCQTHSPRLIGPTKEFEPDYIVLLEPINCEFKVRCRRQGCPVSKA